MEMQGRYHRFLAHRSAQLHHHLLSCLGHPRKQLAKKGLECMQIGEWYSLENLRKTYYSVDGEKIVVDGWASRKHDESLDWNSVFRTL